MAAERPGAAPLVTPEAVVVDLPIAGVGTRTAAIALDLLLEFAVTLLLLFLLGIAATQTTGDLPTWLVIVAFLVLYVAVFWGYPIAMETLARGRTLGKMALGLRVVTTEGAPIRFRHAFIRAAFTLIDFHLLSGVVGVVTALSTRRTQRLGDLAAGTLVIRERAPHWSTQAVTFDVPPGLEGYAATLDVSGVGPHDYATVRQFLLRAGQLDPRARSRLATQIATQLAARMRHQPPPGIHPEAFLVCLAAVVQRRGDTSVARREPPREGFGPPQGWRPDAGTPRQPGGASGDGGGFSPPA